MFCSTREKVVVVVAGIGGVDFGTDNDCDLEEGVAGDGETTGMATWLVLWAGVALSKLIGGDCVRLNGAEARRAGLGEGVRRNVAAGAMARSSRAVMQAM